MTLIIGEMPLELQISLEDLLSVPQTGQADDAIRDLLMRPYIRDQIEGWDMSDVHDYIWDTGILMDDSYPDDARAFVLWCIITDAHEEMRNWGLTW